jgi:hypothetical protein
VRATAGRSARSSEASSYSLALAQLLLASSDAYLGRLDGARQALGEALRLWPGVAIQCDL